MNKSFVILLSLFFSYGPLICADTDNMAAQIAACVKTKRLYPNRYVVTGLFLENIQKFLASSTITDSTDGWYLITKKADLNIEESRMNINTLGLVATVDGDTKQVEEIHLVVAGRRLCYTSREDDFLAIVATTYHLRENEFAAQQCDDSYKARHSLALKSALEKTGIPSSKYLSGAGRMETDKFFTAAGIEESQSMDNVCNHLCKVFSKNSDS